MTKTFGKILWLCLCLCVILSLAQMTTARAEETDTVYVIDSKEDFFAIMDDPFGTYSLEADLDLGTITPLGIEPWGEYEEHFYGVIMGNGHTIRYRLEEIPGVEHYGLFGSLNGAEIINLTVCAEISITKNDAGYCYVGMLAGRSYQGTAISGVDVSGSIYVQNSNPDMSDEYRTYVGGLIGFSVGTVLTSCSADIQVELSCTGGVWGNYGGLVSTGSAGYLAYGDCAYSCELSGSAELNGKIENVELLIGAHNSISTQRVVMDVTDNPTINCDYAGTNNELSGDLDIKLNIAQPSDYYHSPELTILENCEGSRFDGVVSVSGFSSKYVYLEMARNCELVELNGNVVCKIKCLVNFDGLKECRSSVFNMDIEIECEDSSDINQMADGAYNQGISNLTVMNYVGPNQVDYTWLSCRTMRGETQSYLAGNIDIQSDNDADYIALGSCKECIFEGNVVCAGPGASVYGAERGSDNVVLADLTAKNAEYPTSGTVHGIYMRGIYMEENSILIGKCVATGGCDVIDSSTGCSASVSVETKDCTIISSLCQNCAVVGSAVADSIEPFARSAVNGYVGMDLIIRNSEYFIVGGENCLFEGSVDLSTESQWASVESAVPVTVHLPDGKEWNTANGSLYRHGDYYGFPCTEGHALYAVFPHDHYGVCVEVAGAISPELPDITDQWPDHMQPDDGTGDEPEDGVIGLSLYETADCEESTKISSIMYSCGNFSWNRTVGTDETDQTNYDTCYLKIQRKGMHEDIILERAEITAPDGFSFSSREMVTTKTVNLASVISGEHVIAVYPIYTETEPTAKTVEFLINGESYSTGTQLKANPDAGKLYMRSSFDASGLTSWEDTLLPDFSGLKNESSKYDSELAKISAAFAGAVYKVSDIQKTLKNFGFSNIQLYNYNETNDQVVTEENRDKVAAAFATKRMIFDGEIKTVVAVVVRGTVSEEWYGNFDIKDGERHSGFEKAKTHLMPVLCQYLNDYTSGPTDTKIMITGHSRGAAVSNLVAAELNNTYAAVFAARKDIYTYTFATPNSTKKDSDQCNNVFNIINSEDVVTAVPGGFRHVGKDYYISQFEEGEVYDNVQAKFQKLTKDKGKFSVWPDAFYKIAEKVFVIGGYCSDLSWSQAKENLLRMVAICKLMTIDNLVENVESVSEYFIGWLDLLDYLDQLGSVIPNDSTTAGDRVAALMLNMSGELSGPRKYIIDRIWCNHAMEYYYSWITTADVVETKTTLAEDIFHKIVVAIRCPVDVNVYDEAGELVASIVNDQVVVGAGETCNVFGDEKYFLLDGTNYRFEITGYDAGMVDISVTEYGEMLEKLSVSVFEDLAIRKDETMNLNYSPAAEEAAERCYVSTAAGTVVYPETKTAEELEHHQIQVELNGTGFVTGEGAYEVGELVILSASLEENFQGWYENGVLLTTEPEYAFACDGARTVTALFADGKMEHIHAYTETVTAPTCTEKGYTTYTCDCGDSYTGNKVPMLEHTWLTASCQMPQTCSACGLTEGTTLPHDFAVVVTAPTCVTGGFTLRTCRSCGFQEQVDPVAALGHSWAPATCETLQTCKVCAATTGELADHVFEKGTCVVCGAVDESFLPGDVDGDGIVNYNDALLILRASIKLATLDERQMMIADVDGNGIVNYNDALTILRRSIGLA